MEIFITANMNLQQQQQPGVVLGTDRSMVPIVSVGIRVATASQMNQTPISAVQQLPLSVVINHITIILSIIVYYKRLLEYSLIFVYEKIGSSFVCYINRHIKKVKTLFSDYQFRNNK